MVMRSALPVARSVVTMVLVRPPVTVKWPVEAGVIRVSVVFSCGLGTSLKGDSLEDVGEGSMESSRELVVMGLAVGVVGGAVGFATMSLSTSVLVAILRKRNLAVLKWVGIFPLVPGVLSVSVLPTCMGAGARSMWVGVASFV